MLIFLNAFDLHCFGYSRKDTRFICCLLCFCCFALYAFSFVFVLAAYMSPQFCFAYRLSAAFTSLATHCFAPLERDGPPQSSSRCISHLSFHLLFGVRPFRCADKCRGHLGKSNNEDTHIDTHMC